MNGKDAFEKVMREEGYTRQALSAYLDETPQNLNQQLGYRVKDLKTERLSELLNSIGWDITFKKIGYKKVSRTYLRNLSLGLCDVAYASSANEAKHRNDIFYTTEEGFAILDNRDNEDRSKGIIEFPDEESMMETLKILCGEE